MTFPLDKLAVINHALALTGSTQVAVEDDGSDEWTVGSAAYESAIEYMLEQGNWNFATAVVELNKVPGAPLDTTFKDIYAKPQDCMHLIWVRSNEIPSDYRILGNQVILNAVGGKITAKYIRHPVSEDQIPATFWQALQHFVMAGLYRGLNEDIESAKESQANAQALLQQAKTRSGQEEAKRGLFNSRLREARNVRRPFPSLPNRWGGTDVPS